MGNLLGAPVIDKTTHVGVTARGDEYGVSSMQGWRVHMEDAHIAETLIYAAEAQRDMGTYNCIELPGHSLFAVFDGHGGTFAAEYSGSNFCRVLSRQTKFIEYAKLVASRQSTNADETISAADRTQCLGVLREALTTAFVELDKEIYCAVKGQHVPDANKKYQQLHSDFSCVDGTQPPPITLLDKDTKAPEVEVGDSGTTVCVVLLTPYWIVCANAGDSRAVMSRLGQTVVPLSYDHKPDDESEERRIRAAGGYVAGGRVEGDLAVSRGLGDFRFKNASVIMAASFSGLYLGNGVANGGGSHPQPTITPGDQKVSPIPDIVIQDRNPSQDEFIIVACDGIWDVQSNDDAVKTVGEMFQEGESNLGLICEEYCDLGLVLGSKDNMTALVVKLDGQKVGQGGGVLARRSLREKEHGNKALISR